MYINIIYLVLEYRIRAGFELFFRSYFDKFTEKKPSDRWLMTIAKGNKNHPLIREEEWTRFLGEQTTALFQCKVKFFNLT